MFLTRADARPGDLAFLSAARQRAWWRRRARRARILGGRTRNSVNRENSAASRSRAMIGRERSCEWSVCMARPARFIAGPMMAIAACAALSVTRAQEHVPASPPNSDLSDRCPGLVAADAPRTIPAALRLANLGDGQARLTYVGHSTFLIESPRLVRIATDYNDYVKTPILPDIVTMNHAHSTHYTDHPDRGIKYVLRGWSDDGSPVGHDLAYQDVRVRSVATNIRDWGGGTIRHGNSIFVFETAQLCIAHLGHLHHTLTQQQLNEIGRVDVVLVPVDGTYTLD